MLAYDPDPRGIASAREAVARYYADHDAVVDPADILLTSSSSEAYSFLFRLLCDPGDEILVAQPSYPLFDFLADLDDVTLRFYPLFCRLRMVDRPRGTGAAHRPADSGYRARTSQQPDGACDFSGRPRVD